MVEYPPKGAQVQSGRNTHLPWNAKLKVLDKYKHVGTKISSKILMSPSLLTLYNKLIEMIWLGILKLNFPFPPIFLHLCIAHCKYPKGVAGISSFVLKILDILRNYVSASI